MKTNLKVSVAREFASIALEYWKQKFEEKKEKFLSDKAEEPIFLWFGKKGKNYAQQIFIKNLLDGGEASGCLWEENNYVNFLEQLLGELSILDPDAEIIVGDKELVYLSWGK